MSEPEVAYRPTIRIDRVEGPIRHAWLPAKDDAVVFGHHGAVAEHYGSAPGTWPALPTTIDYVIAAAGG